MIEFIDQVDYPRVLEEWRGTAARIWRYSPSLGRLALQLRRPGELQRMLYIVGVSCQYVQGPFHWSDSQVEVVEERSGPDEPPTMIRDTKAGFLVRCSGFGMGFSDLTYDLDAMSRTVIRCETGEEVEVEGDTLVGAMLAGRNLHRALLEKADLRAADLSRADLRSARLDGAMFDGADLAGALLPACTAHDARFVRASLVGALMRSAGFERADFTGANLRGADVGRSHFAGANFSGADVRVINLADADLRGASADRSTVWPDGFDPEAHGVIVR